MPTDKQVLIPGRIPSALRRMALVAALGSVPLSAGAIGVGEAELLSGYAQPLSVRIPVTVTEADGVLQASELSVRLMPSSAYAGMGLNAPPLNPDNFLLNVSGSGHDYLITLVSSQRVREPMMTLLLEVRASGVRIVRELPILFDLPAPARKAPPAAPVYMPVPMPKVAAEPEEFAPAEPGISAAPLAVPANEAPVALMTPEPAPVRQQRASSAPRRPAKAAKPSKKSAPAPVLAPKLSTFKLASWNQSASVQLAPSQAAPTHRFKLDEHFTSYTQLAQAGAAPAPATQPAAQPVAAQPAPALVTDAPVAEPVKDGGLAWYWWLLISGLAYAASSWLMGLRQRRTDAMVEESVDAEEEEQEAVAASVVAQPEPVAAVRAAPEPAPQPKPEIARTVEWHAAEPVPGPALSAPAAAAASKTNDIARRLADLVAKGTNDPNVMRKTQLVSAYLDLGRVESAESLLSELEAEHAAGSRPKFTLIKG